MRSSQPSQRAVLSSASPVAQLVIGLVALGQIGCSALVHKPETHRQVAASEFADTYTPVELAEDLHELRRVVEEVHPHPYGQHSEAEIDVVVDRLTARVDHPMTRLEFYPLAAELAAAFGDSHTSVQAPGEEWTDFLASGGHVLPLACTVRDDDLVVSCWIGDEHGPQLGCTLREVNGVAIATLRDRALVRRAGERPFVLADFARNLLFQLWLAGVRAPFDVRADCNGASTLFAGIAGSTAEGLCKAQATTAKTADWSLRWLENDIALIDYRRMSDSSAWDEFLAETFAEIQRRAARGVIVDLRSNGGGNATGGETLLSYLTSEPFRMQARMEWRSSARYRAHLKAHVAAWLRWLPLQYVHPVGRKLWSVDEGGIAVLESEAVTPDANELRFDGRWCLLIGPSTFSSAVMLANTVEDECLAPLFGVETGGVPNSYGEVYSCDLTHTRLQLGVSAALHVRVNGDESNARGVLPTHEVVPTEADIAASRDAVLEAAADWIRRDRVE